MSTTLKLLAALTLAVAGLAVPLAAFGNNNPAHEAVTLCHKPGTPAEHTIVVDDSSVLQAHLEHGDTLGACQPHGTTGTETTPTHPGTTTPPGNGGACPPGFHKGDPHTTGNDDCVPNTPDQPAPPRTVTVVQTVPGPTQTVTVTQTVPKVIVKTRTRTITKTKIKVIRKQCSCPPGTRMYRGKCHGIAHGKG